MATYQDIRGLRVKYLSADPSNTVAGEVWYNSTTGTLRTNLLSAAWSSTSPILQSRDSAGGAGIQTAALMFGGRNEVSGGPAGGPTAMYNLTEEYNGTGFSQGGALNQGRVQMGGVGTQTAALGAGGYFPPAPGWTGVTEEYDGSSWTAVTAMPTGTFAMGSAGTQTAAVLTGGRTDTSPNWVTATYEYDGTNWTSGGVLGTARTLKASMTGILTAAVAFGGDLNPPASRTDKVEEYNGTSWTEVNALPTVLNSAMASGPQTSALSFGGNTPVPPTAGTLNTFTYDGTNFTATGALGTIINDGTSIKTAPSNSTGLQMGGYGASSYTGVSQEFNSSGSVITPGAWASGGAIPGAGRQGYGVGTGTQTATIIAGGPPTTTQTQFYDGASWTSLASIPSGATSSQGFGDSEELLMAGGNTGAPYSALTYVYSRPGDSWTAVSSPGNLNTARALGAGCGALSTAGIIAGGDIPAYTAETESWDGSAWTIVNALPTATGNAMGSCGTQAAGLAWSGQNPGDATAEETYEWDGTNWAVGGSRLIGVRGVRGGAGTQTAALTFGGWLDPGGSASTEGYDGTAWSTRPNMAAVGANNFGTGTQASALRAGGTDGPGYTVVEEFTGETLAANIETLTTS